MSEFVVIQVGQCGNQIGSCLLPEILSEYGISPNSEINNKTPKVDLQRFVSSFFHIDSDCTKFDSLGDLIKTKAKARFLCIDMEDSVVARVKTGKYRDLYDKKCLITHYPGSGNNWAEGFCSHGPKFKQKILKAVTHTVEQCDNLHGFLLLFSMGGGTGSGLGTFIVQLLSDYYPNVERFVVCVYPTGTEDVITCPYNMAFATQQLLNNATCVFPVENRTLLDISARQTGRYNVHNITSPFKPFEDLNKIVVDMILHVTSGSRFSGKINIDMNEINTNMVPFPKLNFISTGFSPINMKYFKNTNNQVKRELFLTACSRNNQLIKIDPLDRRYICMSVMLLGRGNFSVEDMREYVDKLKPKLHCALWSNKIVKAGLCDVPPNGLDLSMLALCNTTGTSQLLQKITRQFKLLYQRKAHVHHYTAIPQFNVEQFQDCQNDLDDIIQFYSEIK